MPQDSDPKARPGEDAIARHVLDDVSAEPIPARLIELAEKLESVLATTKRKQKPQDPR